MTAPDVDPRQRDVRTTPRLFIAIPLAESARAAVEELVEEVRSGLRNEGDDGRRADPRRTEVRWVRMDGLHLTLRFLGPTPRDRTADLAQIVDETATAAPPFEVEIAGGGAFPSAARPRALWLGIARGQDEIGAVAGNLSRRLQAAGWPAEPRPFRGHLTLGRADGRPDGRRAVRILEEVASRFRTHFEADRLVLFESVTGRGPARYEPVHEARFSG